MDKIGFCLGIIRKKGFPVIEEDEITCSHIIYETIEDVRYASMEVKLTFKEGEYKSLLNEQ